MMDGVPEEPGGGRSEESVEDANETNEKDPKGISVRWDDKRPRMGVIEYRDGEFVHPSPLESGIGTG